MIISPQSNGRYLIPYNIWHVAQMIPGFLTFCSPINIEYLRTKKNTISIHIGCGNRWKNTNINI